MSQKFTSDLPAEYCVVSVNYLQRQETAFELENGYDRFVSNNTELREEALAPSSLSLLELSMLAFSSLLFPVVHTEMRDTRKRAESEVAAHDY